MARQIMVVSAFLESLRLKHLYEVLDTVADTTTDTSRHPFYWRICKLFRKISDSHSKLTGLEPKTIEKVIELIDTSHIHFLMDLVPSAKLHIKEAMDVIKNEVAPTKAMINRLTDYEAPEDSLGSLDMLPMLVRCKISKVLMAYV